MPNIEELMRKAMAEGKFDNLPGKGKPLHLGENNPYADPEWDLAYKMLKDSGFSLPWIETIREIEKDIEAARQELKRTWDWFQVTSLNKGGGREPATQSSGFVFAEWERALAAFKEKVGMLNKRIRNYNLEVPNARFQRPALNYEREVEKITSSK